MIKQDYTGKSNIIKRIVAILNKKAPLPLDQQGDVDWGADGKVLATDGVGGTKWVTASSGGGNVADVKVNGSSVVDANKVANVTVPTALSDLSEDSTHRVVTDTEKSTWSGKQDALTPGTNIQINGTTISATDTTYSDATQSTAGLMSTTDKTKLDGIANGAEVNVQADWNEADSSSDAYIANKPTIPAAQIQSDWNQSDTTAADYIKNKPTIPTVNDGTLTIQENGTTVGTFSANQSGNTTVNLTGGGGSGGHTIESTDGTDLPQEDNLQFVGVYTNDDSANDRTKVNIVREMTKAQMTALSSAEAEGFIYTTDEDDIYAAIDAEDVKYGGSDVKTALDGKVNRSGDTMTGVLQIAGASGYPLTLNRTSGTVWIDFQNSGTSMGLIGVLTDKKPYFYDTSLHRLSMRTVTTLVNESVSISSGSGSKTYSALTATALSAYDEIHIMAGYGNVFINGMATKAQMAAVTAKTYPANGRLHFYGGNVLSSGSETVNYYFRIRADANGLNIINGSVSSTLDYLLIEGITY